MYYSRSSPQVAYLVSQGRQQRYDGMQLNLQREEKLVHAYGITPTMQEYGDNQHHERDHSFPMRIDGTISAMMTNVLRRYGQVTIHGWEYNYNRIPLIVQRLAKVPLQPTFLIGLSEDKQHDMLSGGIEWFAQEIRRRQQTKAFETQFKTETRRLIRIMKDHSGDFMYLFFDFQLLLDTAGNFYYIDLDRDLKSPLEECEKCLNISSLEPGMEKLLFWLVQATAEDFLQLQLSYQEAHNGSAAAPRENFGEYFFQPIQAT